MKSNPELFKTESNFKRKIAGLHDNNGSARLKQQVRSSWLNPKFADFNMKLIG